jgi:hypothetical protein
VPVATHEFANADFDAVYVELPIQDETRQEIAARAETVVDDSRAVDAEPLISSPQCL